MGDIEEANRDLVVYYRSRIAELEERLNSKWSCGHPRLVEAKESHPECSVCYKERIAELEDERDRLVAENNRLPDCGYLVSITAYKSLEAENKRLIDIAGDALGFSPYQRDQDTVEVLANHCKWLAEEFSAMKVELSKCKAESDLAFKRAGDRWKQYEAERQDHDITKKDFNALRARCERLEGAYKVMIEAANYAIYRSEVNVATKLSDAIKTAKQAMEV